MDTALEEYRLNEAAQRLYQFFWSEFCDWYIELAKLSLQAEGDEQVMAMRRRMTQGVLATVLETALRVGVASEEGPRELLERADLAVDGVRGFTEILEALAA